MATPAKREAARAAQHAPIPTVCTDASGARIRAVGVHLTPFVKGLEGAAIDNPKRWARLWGVSPAKAVAKTLRRIGVSPRAAVVTPEPDATVSLSADRDGELRPLATFWDGLTEAEVREALAALAASGWEPGQ